MRLELTSPAFAAGAVIPRQYTCEGANHSPPLTWTHLPEGTRSVALVVDDPDAPGRTWVHWVAWNIPPTARGLAEGITPTDPRLEQGQSDFGSPGYGGPCPPRGHGHHRYFFRLYALDTSLTLSEHTTRPELDQALAGHVLATAELMGTYHRDR